MQRTYFFLLYRVIEKATEEEAVDVQKLIQTPDNDMEDDIIKQQRSKSAELLKRELEKHGKSGSRDYLIKVNTAMSVLYARQVLISLFGHWPETGHLINADLLGCKEVQQIPCVLDLLNKTESRDGFQKVSFFYHFCLYMYIISFRYLQDTQCLIQTYGFYFLEMD